MAAKTTGGSLFSWTADAELLLGTPDSESDPVARFRTEPMPGLGAMVEQVVLPAIFSEQTTRDNEPYTAQLERTLSAARAASTPPEEPTSGCVTQ